MFVKNVTAGETTTVKALLILSDVYLTLFHA